MALGKVFSLDEVKQQRPKLYTMFSLALDTARVNEEFIYAGNNMRVTDASDLEAEISVRFNEAVNDLIPMRIGRLVEMPFYRFFVTHAAQAGKTLDLAVAMERDMFDIRDDVIPWVGAVFPGATVGAYGQVSVTTTATLIRGAQARRQGTIIQNLDAANDLYIGFDNSVTTANAGHKLISDAAVEIKFQGTIYGIRSAGSGNAAWLEERSG